MSRQKGRRDRPAPERRALVEQYSRRERRKDRRARRAEPAARAPDRPVSWAAVIAGTLLSIVVYGVMAAAIVQSADGDSTRSGWIAAGAALIVPLLMGLLGFLTRAKRPWRTAMTVTAAVIPLFLLGSFASRDVATGYVLAIGAGAAYSMRLDPELHDRRWRLWTVVGLAVYTKVVYLLSPGIAVVAAPLLPVFGVSIVDSVRARRLDG